jgi:hypothetical protein
MNARAACCAFAVLALCVIAKSASATTMIAVREKTFLILAADGKEAIADPSKKEPVPICKIGFVNNIFWASVGLFQATGPYAFSVNDAASRAMSGSGNMGDRVSGFAQDIAPLLRSNLLLGRATYPDFFDAHTAHKPHVLTVAFASFENGEPMLRIVNFDADYNDIFGDIPIKWSVEVSPPSDDRDASFVTTLGYAEAIAATLAEVPEEQRNDKFAAPGFDIQMIELEIANNPADVGPPIALVKIGKDGPDWIRKGAC